MNKARTRKIKKVTKSLKEPQPADVSSLNVNFVYTLLVGRTGSIFPGHFGTIKVPSCYILNTKLIVTIFLMLEKGILKKRIQVWS